METKIIIKHDTVDALKSHPIWEQIHGLLFADGPISIIEVGDNEAETE